VSLELRDALEQIDTILGKTTSEDILDGVFGSFCVGK
jgi:tRNA U34 5-carboxymethylaminomethyl modifying GTPase MnmE/TrmE